MKKQRNQLCTLTKFKGVDDSYEEPVFSPCFGDDGEYMISFFIFNQGN
jgi:hypothetical protein